MDPQVYKDVISFMTDELGVKAEHLTLQTRLRQDLKLDAAKGAEFVADFCYAFMVDRGAYRVTDYFSAAPQPHPAWAFLLSLSGNGKSLKTLTVGDLVKAAEKGRF